VCTDSVAHGAHGVGFAPEHCAVRVAFAPAPVVSGALPEPVPLQWRRTSACTSDQELIGLYADGRHH